MNSCGLHLDVERLRQLRTVDGTHSNRCLANATGGDESRRVDSSHTSVGGREVERLLRSIVRQDNGLNLGCFAHGQRGLANRGIQTLNHRDLVGGL